MRSLRLLPLLCLVGVSAFFAPRVDAQSAQLLLASDEPAADTLATALSVELASRGWQVVRGPAPRGETLLERAGDAQRHARMLTARTALWIEAGLEGGAAIHAVEANGDATRNAPLPAPLASLEARTFAAVAASLVDELESPPPRLRVRVQVAIESEDGSSFVVDDARAEVRTRDGVVASASPFVDETPGETPVILEVPITEEAPSEEAPSEETPSDETPSEEPLADEQATLEEEAHDESRDDATLDATDEAHPIPNTFFGVDLAPFVGSSSFARGRGRRTLSFGLAGAYSHSVHGVGAAAGVHLTRAGQEGVVVAGGGVFAGGDVSGAQAAGGGVIALGRVHGAQGAGGFTYAHGGLEGVQMSGGLNVARGTSVGAQLTGGLNLAIGDFTGVQMAPVNIVAGAMHGAQVGTVNVAGHVDGVQVGIVNVSKDADFAFGLVNVVTEGRTHLQLTATSEGFAFATLVHGGDHWHYLYSIGARPFGGDEDTAWAGGLGIGLHLTPTERVFVDVDLLGYYLSDGDHGDQGSESLTQLRGLVGFRLSPRVALLAGLTYNAHATYNDDSDYAHVGRTTLYEEQADGLAASPGWRVVGYPGLTLGLQVF